MKWFLTLIVLFSLGISDFSSMLFVLIVGFAIFTLYWNLVVVKNEDTPESSINVMRVGCFIIAAIIYQMLF